MDCVRVCVYMRKYACSKEGAGQTKKKPTKANGNLKRKKENKENIPQGDIDGYSKR